MQAHAQLPRHQVPFDDLSGVGVEQVAIAINVEANESHRLVVLVEEDEGMGAVKPEKPDNTKL